MGKARVLRVETAGTDQAALDLIAGEVKRGGVIIYPTDTIYGLGCSALERAAVERVFQIKGRARGKPLILLIAEPGWARELSSNLPPLFQKLAERFWPGPLTMVLEASPMVLPEITAGTGTVALRLPGSEFARRLVAACGVPLVSTSANISGEENIAEARRLIELFGESVDLIVDAGDLESPVESTVVSLARGKLELLREGRIKFSEIIVVADSSYQ